MSSQGSGNIQCDLEPGLLARVVMDEQQYVFHGRSPICSPEDPSKEAGTK